MLAMSAMTQSGRRGLARIQRLFDALADPARRERTAVAVLLGYVALWTLYGTIAKGSQDIHADMSEQFALGRELALGYPKHPPLTMAVVRAWFAVFPTADWAYYLLAMVNVGLALWIVWRLTARFLDGEKRVLGLVLLTLVPFFNFHGLKFNVNTVLLPLWAATTLWFLRSFETRRLLDAALAGLGAAAAMYGKYWSVFLLLGLGIAALADRRRATYFRSLAPWVTIAVGALALAPHAAWLIANDFAPFSYAVVLHGAGSLASTIGAALGYLAGSVAYVAVPLLIVAVGVLALAVAFPFVMVAIAPAIAFAIHSSGPAPGSAHASLLARPIEQLWRETTDRPLRIFSGFDELTDGVAFYLPSHPLAVRVFDGIPSAAIEERIDRDGIALLCPARSSVAAADWCANAAIARARCSPPGKQMEIEVSRRYLGVEGKPARYLIIAIPPRQPQTPPASREPLADCIARHVMAGE